MFQIDDEYIEEAYEKAVERYILVYDDDAESGDYTKRLKEQMNFYHKDTKKEEIDNFLVLPESYTKRYLDSGGKMPFDKKTLVIGLSKTSSILGAF